MKHIFFHLLIFLSLTTWAQAPTLKVGGTIQCEDDAGRSGALVTVSRDGKPFTSFPTSAEGTYHLYLPFGSDYTVNVTKKGYVKKIFTVAATNVPKEEEGRNFPVIITDIELIGFYPGVDYSVFDQPMNKYFYNTRKKDFEYDKDYLQKMLALVDEVKLAKKEAIAMAKQKAEAEIAETEVARQKALKEELLAVEAEMLKKMQQELAENKKEKAQSNSSSSTSLAGIQPHTIDALSVVVTSKSHLNELLLKYAPGVTEEVYQDKHVIIIQRIVVRNDMAWVYHKKIFQWGGTAFFRDGNPITESTFELETANNS